MLWIGLLGLSLVAGFIILDDDDDQASTGQDEPPGQEDPDLPPNTFAGTDGNDILIGNQQDNSLLGREGDDSLEGRIGGDRLFGDDGMDTLFGGDGNDSVFGGDGDDFLNGGRGDDLIRGGADHDVLIDRLGSDTMNGDLGQDLIISSGQLPPGLLQAQLQASGPENGPQDLLRQLGTDMTDDPDRNGDSVDGGQGDDTLLFGVDDTVTGGDGADRFITGSWLEGQDAATITDFQLGEDQLVYTYDPAAGGEPELTVENAANGSGGSDAIVYADGVEVLRILAQDGQFDPALDIRLLPYPVAAG
ncbi:type I secretion protein [Phaeobacter sp. QD34_3]|uniref:calcium-binding protein n=1 Tax=unclassified Phaeobacter TaxID=2621772 RepID=UPI00237F8288|nr:MULTISPECIES: type I secretion protein [unclassified Phaeobacter]MDE4131651.1 type I secretion protein [Phaeobacter sp. QD34_3]MDE4135260.1 type I secretion protein [Phaeobacter sp. QD34_24]